MVAFYIANFINKSLNWGMASALSVMLLTIVLIIAALFGGLRWMIANKRGAA